MMSIFSNLSWQDFVVDPGPFALLWIVSGILALAIPRGRWNRDKQRWYNYMGYQVEYEQQQRAYEEAQNGNNQNNQNGNYYIKDCKWFQFQCRKQNAYYMRNNGNGDQMQLPDWYYALGGEGEEERRQREENRSSDQNSGALKFVYGWTVVIFVLIIVYGTVVLFKKQSPVTLIVTLLVFSQFALMQMITMAQGVIQTEGRQMEESVYGWSGQLGVLMVYSDFWLMLYSLLFSLLFGVRIFLDRRRSKSGDDKLVAEESGYSSYEAPKAGKDSVV